MNFISLDSRVKIIGKTANGFSVTFDKLTSHALTHFSKNPNFAKLVKDSIEEIVVTGNIYRQEMSARENIGYSDLVPTEDTDEIVYALRPLRQQYSRFVKNKMPQPTTCFVIDLRKVNDTTYSLYTAFIGKLTPSFPGGDFLPEQSKEFWSKHALVYGSQEIVPGTETVNCPW